MSSKIKPFAYQKEGVRLIEQFGGRVLLADEPGLGKTLQVLWSLKRNPEWMPALVVCPASLKFNWQWEARHNADLAASICESKKPPVHNGRDFTTMAPITIINYDILKSWLPYLRKLKFKTVVFDECHYMANVRTRRTKAGRDLATSIERVIAVSGTPILNRPSELWPVLNMLWPEQYPSFWSYAQSYCQPRLTPWGWDYTGSSNLDQLNRELLVNGMIRRRKVDVLKDLPPKVHRIVPCELSNRAEYDHATRDFLGWLKKTAAHKVSRVKRAEAMAKYGYLLRLTGRGKMREVVAWANRFLEETGEKLVLMATHKKAIDCLQRRIKTKSVVVDGSTSLRMRHLSVEAFQKDEETRLFIGNIQAAGVGITLTAASEMGLVEWAHRPGDIKQAADRIHRISQDRPVFINYFAAGGTIEVEMCKRLVRKQKSMGEALDGGVVEEDFDFYAELIDILEKRNGRFDC